MRVAILTSCLATWQLAVATNYDMPLTDQELMDMPKIELHNHGDGALSPQRLCELVYANGVEDHYLNITNIKAQRSWYEYENPVDLFYDISDPMVIVDAGLEGCAELLAPWVQSKATNSLTHFLEPFDTITWMLNLPGGPSAMSQAFADRQIETNVIYSEMRYNPGLLVPPDLCPQEDWVCLWACSCKNIALQKQVVDESMDKFAEIEQANPGFRFKVILACVRHLDIGDCESLLQLAQDYMPYGAHPRPDHFAGVGLAGAEAQFPNSVFYDAFANHSQGLKVSVHSGEVGDPHDCVDAVTHLGASRIGHGYLCVNDTSTINLLLSHNVHIEACPSSSRATAAVPLSDVPWEEHMILEFITHGFSFGFNTDDPGLTDYTVPMELRIAIDDMGFTPMQIKQTQIDGANAAFTTQAEKDAMVSEIETWWMQRGSSDSSDSYSSGGCVAITPQVAAQWNAKLCAGGYHNDATDSE